MHLLLHALCFVAFVAIVRARKPDTFDVVPKALNGTSCDSTHSCPTASTCCLGPTGQWGCCPYYAATCCADGLHCCPAGYMCNGIYCVLRDSNYMVPAMPKFPTYKHEVASVRRVRVEEDDEEENQTKKAKALKQAKDDNSACVDGSLCPAGTTCCQQPSGRFGCCPYNNAVCCSDGLHCCPYGSYCDASMLRCISARFPFAKKPAATKIATMPPVNDRSSEGDEYEDVDSYDADTISKLYERYVRRG